jgi:hypothetical protein
MNIFEMQLGHSSSNYNVSGSQRFKYFCPAKSLSTQQHSWPSSRIIFSPHSQQQEKQGDNDTKQKQIQSNEKNTPQHNDHGASDTCREKKEYKDDGTQTENCMDHLTDSEKQRLKELIQEREIKKRIEMERERRKRERKAQEEALPPLKDAKAIRVYRRFLEENERKDFELREKELDDEIEMKLQKIKKNLKKRYGNSGDSTGITSEKKKRDGMKKETSGIGMISSNVSSEEGKSNSTVLPKLQVTRDTEMKGDDGKQVSNLNAMRGFQSQNVFNGSMERYNRLHAKQVASAHMRETSSRRKKQHHINSLEIVQSSFATNVK